MAALGSPEDPSPQRPVPGGMVGAWRRESITVDGGSPAEPQTVRYLQAGHAYADLRVHLVAGGADDCFAGTTSWDGSWAEWAHDLDLHAGRDLEPATDRGEIEWLDDGGMAERGTQLTTSGPQEYLEVWRPLAIGHGGMLVMTSEAPLARLVRVGGHAIVVCDRRSEGGGFVARYQQLDGGTWRSSLHLGASDQLPTPPEEAPDLGDVIELGGIRWTVEQSTASADGPSIRRR